MDERDLRILEVGVDQLLEQVDSALDKATDYEQFQALVENQLDQVVQQLEQSQWTSLTTSLTTEATPDLNYTERVKLIRIARQYYLKDPLIHQATSLITNYTFGEGLRYSCNDEKRMEIMDDFWQDEDNLLELTSHQAQEQKSIELVIDGEIFFVLFKEPDGRIKVRTLPTEEITQVITSPDDYRRQLYYERSYMPQRYDFKSKQWGTNFDQKIVYYADWRNYAPGKWGFERGMRGLQQGVVYQIATNRIGRQKRGNTETYPALDWVKAHRGMLQDWVTIVKAYSTLAWKAKIKGDDARDVDRIKSKIAAILPAFTPGTGQLGQPAGTGGVQFENDDVSLTPMKTAGMATNPSDARQIRLMAGAGLGIMEHYFGDAGNANLATAQAMELPMLKKFAARQRFWESVYLNIMNYVLVSAVESGRIDGKIDQGHNAKGLLVSKRLLTEDTQHVVIQAPPILTKNLAEVAQGIVPLVTNKLVPKKEAARYAMKALDIQNVEAALVDLEKVWEEDERLAKELAAHQMTMDTEMMKQKNDPVASQPGKPTPGTPTPPSGQNPPPPKPPKPTESK